MAEERVDGPVTGLDSPPEAHAGVFTEDQDLEDLVSQGYGPTSLPHAEEEEEEEPQEEAVAEEEPEEEVSEAKAPAPSEAEKKAAMLDWIMQNPERFAAMQVQQRAEEEEDRLAALLADPRAPKPIDEMEDRELFQHAIQKEVRGVLRESLPELVKDMKSMKEFKGNVETIFMKTSTYPDGTPMHPRWDELQGAMKELSHKHPTLGIQETYFLADKIVPSADIVAPPPVAPRAKVVDIPKKRMPTKEQNRAAMLTQYGRSSQTLKEGGPKDIRHAVEQAMAEHGFTGEGG